VRGEAHAAVHRIAEHLAAAHDMASDVAVADGYPVTVNNPPAAADTLATARWLLGDDQAVESPSPVMGAEDFSYVLERVPGAMAFLGTRPARVSPAQVAPNHSNRMVLDEDALAAGGRSLRCGGLAPSGGLTRGGSGRRFGRRLDALERAAHARAELVGVAVGPADERTGHPHELPAPR
jgi:hypothetical protein